MKVRKKELVVIDHKSTDYDPKNHNIMQDNAIKTHRAYRKNGSRGTTFKNFISDTVKKE